MDRNVLRSGTKPFTGMFVCCSGMGSTDKAVLHSKARELGAIYTKDFTDKTTHLVADARGSLKYNVSSCRVCYTDMLT